MEKKQIEDLEIFAKQIRLETFKEILTLGFGHIGGSLSVVELLSVLYGKVMSYNPNNPNWEDRDYLVCSKGHAGPAIYATLALKGFFPLEDLKTLNVDGTNLPSHCDRNKTPGIDMTTGSLGQGVSTALGMALGSKMDNKSNKVYLVVGDGELNEGQCWEGFMFGAHQKLDNIICFVDYNKKQLDDYVSEVSNPIDFVNKFDSFGWNAVSVDGSSVEEIYNAIVEAHNCKGKPSAIILDTVKGQGIPMIENIMANHSVKFDNDKIKKEAAEFCNKLADELAK